MIAIVTLTPAQVAKVRVEARDVVADGKRNKTEKYGAQRDRQATRLKRNEDGFGAEEAACLWLGIDRSQRGVVRSGFKRDLGDLVEVRQTHHRTGRLIVHPKDDDDDAPFVLAIGVLPTFKLMGWCWGHEAKHEEFWEVPPAVPYQAFFVPASELRPMEELLLLLKSADDDAVQRATRERDAIDQRWREIGQWPRPWTTDAAREAWISLRVQGLVQEKSP